MKTGLNIWIYFLILAGLSACDTKQDWFDSGISSPYHDCSIMEYLQKDTANWKLTVELIERAELTHIFEGKDPNYKEITFFAPPSLSILRYVWDKASGKEQFPGDPDRWRALSEDEKNHPEHLVQALDKDWCREMVLRHVIKGKHLKDEIAFRNRDYEQILLAKAGTNYELTGKKQIMVESRTPEQFSCTFIRLMPWKWFH